GIEWRQEGQVFIARGPARAQQGDMVLDADELRAYYRSGAGGQNQIYRMDAVGNVRITSPGRVATGGRAIYDVDQAVVVLKDADPVTLTSGPDVITAQKQMEFWRERNLAVARGAAKAVNAGKTIRADVLTAHFISGADGKNQVDLVEAFDKVEIKTAQERAYCDRAAYNVPTGLARLTGSVKIVRGENQINGCSADIDLNTGVSRMNSCDPGAAKPGAVQRPGKAGRVHGVLQPDKMRK
ncbi:MAG: hypothetical protein HQL36_13125, partial [Alphaproteobacteria bacterium]|nr:hypothetical protein [Alphaproteobacteria bacterium]